MNVDQLLMLDHDAIDYQALAEEALQALALEVEPFIATSALTELAIRRSAVAADTAWTILTRPEQDRHLRAAALEILFELEPDRAVGYMNSSGRADQDLMPTMAKIVAEHPDDFTQELRAALARELARSRGSRTSRSAARSRSATRTGSRSRSTSTARERSVGA